MGNCCAGTHGAEIVLGKKPKSYQSYCQGNDDILDNFLDEREVLGKRGNDKIELVEKI